MRRRSTGVQDRRGTDEDHGVTASEEIVTGRALLEAGSPVAGSMSRAAATVVFEPSAAKIAVDDRFAACLRAGAGKVPTTAAWDPGWCRGAATCRPAAPSGR